MKKINKITLKLCIIIIFISFGCNNHKEHIVCKKVLNSNTFIKKHRRYKDIRVKYYKNGNIKSKEIYENNKLNGISYYYYKNGNIKSKEIYENNKLNGISYYYYKNGNIKKEKSYINNKLNGTLYIYYENGIKYIINNYKEGIKHGSCIFYDRNGDTAVYAVYNMDIRLIYRKYFGNSIYSEHYIDGELDKIYHVNIKGEKRDTFRIDTNFN